MKIQINKPCHENWNDFTPTEKGAFCKSCRKVVVDFSIMKDHEIIEYIQANKNKNICGKFGESQVNREMQELEIPQWNKINFQKQNLFLVALVMIWFQLESCESKATKNELIEIKPIEKVEHNIKYEAIDSSTMISQKKDTDKSDKIIHKAPTKNKIIDEPEQHIMGDIDIQQTQPPVPVSEPEIKGIIYIEPNPQDSSKACETTNPEKIGKIRINNK